MKKYLESKLGLKPSISEMLSWAAAHGIRLIGTHQDANDLYYYGFDKSKVLDPSEVKGFLEAMKALMILPEFIIKAMMPQYNQYTKETNIKAIYFSTKHGSGYTFVMPYGYSSNVCLGVHPGFILEQKISKEQALHEFGHALDNFALRIHYYWEPIPEWASLNGEVDRIFDARGHLISRYANTNSFEDFAEHFCAYILNGNDFRHKAAFNFHLKKRYEFLRNYVFQGIEYK